MYRSIREFTIGDRVYLPGDPAVNDLSKTELNTQIKLGNVIELPKRKKVKDDGEDT